jgi:hypothetical protein
MFHFFKKDHYCLFIEEEKAVLYHFKDQRLKERQNFSVAELTQLKDLKGFCDVYLNTAEQNFFEGEIPRCSWFDLKKIVFHKLASLAGHEEFIAAKTKKLASSKYTFKGVGIEKNSSLEEWIEALKKSPDFPLHSFYSFPFELNSFFQALAEKYKLPCNFLMADYSKDGALCQYFVKENTVAWRRTSSIPFRKDMNVSSLLEHELKRALDYLHHHFSQVTTIPVFMILDSSFKEEEGVVSPAFVSYLWSQELKEALGIKEDQSAYALPDLYFLFSALNHFQKSALHVKGFLKTRLSFLCKSFIKKLGYASALFIAGFFLFNAFHGYRALENQGLLKQKRESLYAALQKVLPQGNSLDSFVAIKTLHKNLQGIALNPLFVLSRVSLFKGQRVRVQEVEWKNQALAPVFLNEGSLSSLQETLEVTVAFDNDPLRYRAVKQEFEKFVRWLKDNVREYEVSILEAPFSLKKGENFSGTFEKGKGQEETPSPHAKILFRKKG